MPRTLGGQTKESPCPDWLLHQPDKLYRGNSKLPELQHYTQWTDSNDHRFLIRSRGGQKTAELHVQSTERKSAKSTRFHLQQKHPSVIKMK